MANFEGQIQDASAGKISKLLLRKGVCIKFYFWTVVEHSNFTQKNKYIIQYIFF